MELFRDGISHRLAGALEQASEERPMSTLRRSATAVAALLAATFVVALAGAAPSCAQDYPTRPIRIVVPYTPAGAVDLLARTLGPRLTEAWGQQVVVDNRPGAGGNLGTEAVAKSPPDGYTLLLSTGAPLTTNVALYKSLRYDPERDLDAITLLAESAVLVVANKDLPVGTIADVITLARQRPAPLLIGSSGHGTLGHFLTTQIAKRAGTSLSHVPYRGGVPAVTAAMTGEVQLAIVDTVAALPFVGDGRVKGIAVSGSRRASGAPDIPTLSESGVPGLAMVVWIAMMAPKGTPQEIQVKLNAEIQRSLRDEPFRAAMLRLGLEPVTDMALQRLAGYLREEIPRWRGIVEESGLELQQ
jgi:tripartite-type tricarboxylate transporter receptor subunit TctC